PQRRQLRPRQRRLHLPEWVSVQEVGLTRVRPQHLDLLWEVVRGEELGATPQGERRDLVGARCPAQTQVYATGVEGFQGKEVLGDLQRRVVGQHDPAGANADTARLPGDGPDEHGGGHRREGRGVVVLGNPVARVAQVLGEPRELHAVGDGVRPGAVWRHRYQV